MATNIDSYVSKWKLDGVDISKQVDKTVLVKTTKERFMSEKHDPNDIETGNYFANNIPQRTFDNTCHIWASSSQARLCWSHDSQFTGNSGKSCTMQYLHWGGKRYCLWHCWMATRCCFINACIWEGGVIYLLQFLINSCMSLYQSFVHNGPSLSLSKVKCQGPYQNALSHFAFEHM